MLNKVKWPLFVGAVLTALFAWLGMDVPAGLEGSVVGIVMFIVGYVKKESRAKVDAATTVR